MSTPNTMSQNQRPPFPPQNSAPRAFSPPYPSPGPGIMVPAPPPPPPPSGFNQPPPPKRQRIDSQSPSYGSPMLTTMQLPSATSPLPNTPNGVSPPPPSFLMPPPPPAVKDKATDIRTIEDSLSGTGVNIDDEERALTSFGTTSFQQSNANTSFLGGPSFGMSNGGSFSGPGSIGRDGILPDGRPMPNGVSPIQDAQSAEEAARLELEKANYLAGGRRQYELTDPFLLGDAMERRLNLRAYENGVKSPKDGLYHARKETNRPLQKMQVVAPDGSIRVIDQGQTILNSEGGATLSNLMDLISLACKARMTGILDLAARLGKERRDLANGQIPEEWKDIAQPLERSASPAAAQSLKRSYSQTNGTNESSKAPTAAVVNIFRKIAEADRSKEEARLNKRLKRTSGSNGVEPIPSGTSTPGGPGTPTTPVDATKKVTKKDQKVIEAKFTEAQQHKHANETARMATTNLLGANMFGNKKKTYAWMTGGGGASKPAPAPVAMTAAKINTALSDNVPTVVNGVKSAVVVPKGKQVGDWDDASEKPTTIQVRDILTILEGDDRCLKALQQGYNKPEGRE